MQDKEITKEHVLVSVPAEFLVTAGIFAGDAIQIHVEGDRLIMESSKNVDGVICSGGSGESGVG